MTTIRFTPEETAAWYASVPKVALSANAVLRDPQGRIALETIPRHKQAIANFLAQRITRLGAV